MSEHRALGIPISQALLLPPGLGGEALRPALEAVDRVHGDGPLVQLSVEFAFALPEESKYNWIEPAGIPWNIELRPGARHPLLNLLHEIGHFLDHQAIGVPGRFSSPSDDIFGEWGASVARTDAVARLRTVVATAKWPDAVEYADYLLQHEELWARSYAQFVTIRGGNSDVIAELRERQLKARTSSIPVQWEDRDFLSVGEAIETLSRHLGWMS